VRDTIGLFTTTSGLLEALLLHLQQLKQQWEQAHTVVAPYLKTLVSECVDTVIAYGWVFGRGGCLVD
jgi:hypothetical protein